MVILSSETVKPFYTAIVVKPDAYKTVITNERHFETKEQAEYFQIRQALDGNYCYIMPIEI